MKLKHVSFLFVLCLLFMIGAPVSAEIATEDIEDAVEIIQLINEYRAGLGLSPYTFSQTLAETAQGHSEYQAANNISTHKGEGDTTSTDRARAQGYGEDRSIRTDEMIYNGSFATPQKAFDWWKNSPIHNGIMTSPIYHEIGVGIAHAEDGRIYYTVNVGMIQGVTVRGSSSYRAPDPASYVAPVVPVETATPESDGAVYHTYVEGQSLESIAAAYDISVDELLGLNNMSEDLPLADGQILLVRQPESFAPPVTEEPTLVPTMTASPVPTDTPTETPTPTQDATTAAGTVATEAASSQGGTGGDSGDAALRWLWWLLPIALLLIGAAAAFYFWPQLTGRKKEQRLDIDSWLGEGDAYTEGDHTAASITAYFDHLPRQDQVALLEKVARQAFRAYSYEIVEIELLRYVLNAEFLVRAHREDDPDTVQKLVLRVNAPGFNAKTEIRSELQWLNAITQDTKLLVPIPVRARSGDWVVTVDDPDVGIWRHCVVFEYIEAQTIQDEATPRHMEFLGALIGLLHKHSMGFQPPMGFVRKHWDLEGLRGGMSDVPAAQALGALTDEERKVIQQAEKLVAEAMDTLGVDHSVYGLIHGDLHHKSLLFSSGRPVALDFDTCGYGYYVYDLSVAVWDLFSREDFANLRTALLNGYRKVRRLSEQEESLLTHFIAGRLMSQALVWAPRRFDPQLREVADKSIKKVIGQLQSLINLIEGK